MKKRSRGRPRSRNPADERIYIRITADDKRRYEAAAAEAGLSLSAWLKRLADKAS